MSDTKSFENNIKKLEETVSSLESGKLSLDEALTAYKSGVQLVGECKKALDSAKLEIEAVGENL